MRNIIHYRTLTLAALTLLYVAVVVGGALTIAPTRAQAISPLIPFGGLVTSMTPCYSCKNFGCVAAMLTVERADETVNVIVSATSILYLHYQVRPAVNVLGNGYPDPTCFTPYRRHGGWRWRPLSADLSVFQMGTSL